MSHLLTHGWLLGNRASGWEDQSELDTCKEDSFWEVVFSLL